jgi:asparagine synthase (glutamine-hydrolysing)
MCGIVGRIRTQGGLDPAIVAQASESLVARGPDAGGIWSSAHASLAHRRLSILDLSPRSNQPLASDDGRWVVTYNGEVYNFRQFQPAAPSDTVALVAGADPVLRHPHRLRGMFAYGLWDRSEERLYLARDRFGMKPLYYAATPDGLDFASSASVLAEMSGAGTVDINAVRSYLRFGSVRGLRTIFRGVQELAPGTVLRQDRSGTFTERFASVLDGRPGGGARPLRTALEESVAAHLVSDVEVGVFLSGGIDSAIVATLAVEQGADITAFTVGFRGQRIDETQLARGTAESLGIKHVVVDLGAEAPDFDSYFRAMDQPSIDGLNTWIVSRAAAEAGLRVALSGLGGDELFCGYDLFRRIPTLQVLSLLTPKSIRSRLLTVAGGNADKVSAICAAGSSATRLSDELRSVFTNDEVARLTGSFADTPDLGAKPFGVVENTLNLELQGYLRNTLLRDADVFAMANSLELRMPFVDHEVLAAVRCISQAARFVRRKRILVEAVSSPRVRELARLRKRGFALSFEKWLQGSLSARVSELHCGPLSAVVDVQEVARLVARWRDDGSGTMKVWSLVVLDGWLRRHGT